MKMRGSALALAMSLFLVPGLFLVSCGGSDRLVTVKSINVADKNLYLVSLPAGDYLAVCWTYGETAIVLDVNVHSGLETTGVDFSSQVHPCTGAPQIRGDQDTRRTSNVDRAVKSPIPDLTLPGKGKAPFPLSSRIDDLRG